MTTDHERDERELRDLLSKRAEVREGELEALRGFVAQLPSRRRRLPARGLLAAAASVTVLLGVGLVALNFPWGSSGAAPVPPNPAAFANDPRLAVCNAKATDAEAIFELQHVADYAVQLPNAYPLIGLQADPAAPALVIVLKGPGSPERGGETPAPNSHDLCMVVGADAGSWQQVGIVNVDTSGLLTTLPEPSATPIAKAELPWVARCGGVEAGINRILHLPQGTDAMTLNSIAVPISAMSAEPMTIIEYTGAHPFAPQGTPPPSGTTFAPREPLKPGERDLCILSGADPATAQRTIVEYGTQFEAGPPPSVSASPASPDSSVAPVPSGSPAPSPSGFVLRPQIDPADCESRQFSPLRCGAVVEAARVMAGVDWAQITSVHLVQGTSSAIMGSSPIADVTFVIRDGSSVTETVRCGISGQFSLVCTDRPAIRTTTPFADYLDVPCGDVPAGEPGASCATPLPTINPKAKSVPLKVPAFDQPLVAGQHEFFVGQATLPNGILSDASFELLDPRTQTFAVDGAIALVVRPVDPAGKPFDNAYTHGWHPGSEVVNVYLVLDVTSAQPDAMLNVRNLVVR